jgi:hypothetical protein
MTELFDLHADVFNLSGCLKLAFRLLIDLFFTSLVVFGVYVRKHGKNEYLFTYIMFNLITFTLCFLLRQVPIELGFALGMFAVFGILRYRTEPIQIHDLTYLFIVIGIGILNAVVNDQISLSEVLLVNGVIVGMVFFLEYIPQLQKESAMRVYYDDLEKLQAENQDALLEDLQKRTGREITRFKIEHLDLLRSTAELTIFSKKKKQ